jgi:hypothetical protein
VDKLNNKGAFSVIAALLVAVVLIAAVMTAYSSIRYNPVQGQPQILSAVDETNQALKQLLGFTVGYYGSVLKVTGNVTYAKQLANNYLKSGLENVAYVKPEWGLSLNTTDLLLNANWFTNKSYSQGSMQVTYDLIGLGILGVSYNASTRLEVQISNSILPTQAQFKILTDNDEPLINLGTNNIKFYRYVYGNLTWEFSVPTNIMSHGDGTYIIDLPSGVDSNSYVVQVEDTRGISVLASSFSKFTSTIAWNTTAFKTDLDYVDNANLNIFGTHSDFASQQNGPDILFDTLTEQASGLGTLSYNPQYSNLLGSTTIAQSSGNITADIAIDDGNNLRLRSYPSAFSPQTSSIGYSTKGVSYQNIEDRITGSLFTTTNGGQVQSISANLYSTATSQNHNAKAAIYLASDKSLVATSGTKTIIPGDNGWVSFTFSDPKPVLNSNTNYILVASASSADGAVRMYYDSGSANQGYADSETYDNWPNPDTQLISDSQRKYSINCTFTLATQYTVQAEFTGTSDQINWLQLDWAIDSAVTSGTANYNAQLYNFATSSYPSSGDGYMSTSLGTSDFLQTQTITSNPTNFRNTTNGWKLLVTATNTTAAQFDLKIDLAVLTSQFTNYAVNLQEQWLTVNATNLRQDLCIKTGATGSEPLIVQVLQGGSWSNLMTLAPNQFNNVSLTSFIDSSSLTIRFIGSNEANDGTPDTWNIDSVYLKDEPDISFLLNLQESTVTVEILQNGTMRWFGQNMQLTTQTLPIPPIPVKAIHVNQTINGVNQEVPFQIEDWASNYQIPLGLTSNSTVFGNRQMIVFLLTSKVTDFTVWWNGSDTATQTPLAFTNTYFTNDNTGTQTLTNGKITMQFLTGFNVKSTVTGTSTSSTATFMRINTEASTYGAGLSYVIHHGIVRDIVQQEAEWGKTNPPADDGGAHNCPNIYANIVLTLPANATYYTYQTRIMFINSAQARTITDLCPIRLTTNLPTVQIQTENSTLAGSPILQNGTGTFLNTNSVGWTAHHFSQFISENGKGAGIMFADTANQKLYAFDSFASSTSKGAIKASSGLLELLPVSSSQVQFTSAYDITWQGAVATFDGTTPVCGLYDGTTPMGLWILAEYPPTITVTAKS